MGHQSRAEQRAHQKLHVYSMQSLVQCKVEKMYIRVQLLNNVQQGQSLCDLHLQKLLENCRKRLIEQPVGTCFNVLWQRVARV